MMTKRTTKIDDGDGERPEQRLLAERVEPYRKAADGAILDQDARDAAIADQAGKRHRQRGQADIGDPEAVEEAGRKARQQRRDDRDRHGHAHAGTARPARRRQGP